VLVTPLKRVLKSPCEFVGSTVGEAGVLLAWVPIPRIKEPLTDEAPPKGTAGSATRMPFLSAGRLATGLGTWLAMGTAVPLQVDPIQLK
jgi:hypothetical protein